MLARELSIQVRTDWNYNTKIARLPHVERRDRCQFVSCIERHLSHWRAPPNRREERTPSLSYNTIALRRCSGHTRRGRLVVLRGRPAINYVAAHPTVWSVTSPAHVSHARRGAAPTAGRHGNASESGPGATLLHDGVENEMVAHPRLCRNCSRTFHADRNTVAGPRSSIPMLLHLPRGALVDFSH